MKDKIYFTDVSNSTETNDNCAVSVSPPSCEPDPDACTVAPHNHDDLYYRKDYIDNLFEQIKIGAPLTFLPITLSSGDQEITITWANHSLKHGTRPVYLDLYELNSDTSVQSTSRVYTEDNGITYRWYVGTSSSRNWEVRIYGYTNQSNPQLPLIPSLGFNYYTFDFPFT